MLRRDRRPGDQANVLSADGKARFNAPSRPSVLLGLARHAAAAIEKMDPVHAVALGYGLYVLLGFLALSLPWSQAVPINATDRFFMAASAVSTTGLITHDPGTSYTFLGELALLVMMQVGALGYLTLGTFVAVALSDRMSPRRADLTRAAFGLPEGFEVKRLIKRVVIFTLTIEAVGVAALYPQFLAAKVDNPFWMAVFHSVSSFCTAGVSLFSTSFEGFRDNPILLMTIALLAWSGALGFLVLSDGMDLLRRKRTALGFTSRVALVITAGYTVLVTVVLLCVEPAIQALAPEDRLWNALFMTMSAGTTVGFNTIQVAALTPAVIVVLYLVMMFAASPGGTGGGLKTSTLAVLIGLVTSTLRRRSRVTFLGLEILPDKVQQATASVAFYCILTGIAIFSLLLLERAPFDQVLFEAISALSGIGMSMGLTPELSEPGKFVIIALMLIGRIGILAFGIALATRDPRTHDPEDADIVL